MLFALDSQAVNSLVSAHCTDQQHGCISYLDSNKGGMLDVDGSVSTKYVAKVLDELDHYLVTCALVLHCFKTWSHAANTEKQMIYQHNFT